jgi:hypothetical protein
MNLPGRISDASADGYDKISSGITPSKFAEEIVDKSLYELSNESSLACKY